MAQFYTNPARESETYALPDAEVFYAEQGELAAPEGSDDDEPSEAGWYVWACFPGCMPDSDPDGPYASAEEAIDAWRDTNGDEWPEV